MSLDEAILSAQVYGNFVTNQYFDNDQSMHFYNGELYYEDGCIVTEEYLIRQLFATTGEWRIHTPKESIDIDKLNKMHIESKGYTLHGKSYNDCIIKKYVKENL